MFAIRIICLCIINMTKNRFSICFQIYKKYIPQNIIHIILLTHSGSQGKIVHILSIYWLYLQTVIHHKNMSCIFFHCSTTYIHQGIPRTFNWNDYHSMQQGITKHIHYYVQNDLVHITNKSSNLSRINNFLNKIYMYFPPKMFQQDKCLSITHCI